MRSYFLIYFASSPRFQVRIAVVQSPISKSTVGHGRSIIMAGKSLNRVQLIGNLGKDPEIKYTPSGTPVAKITIATNERFKDKSGEWQDRTEWHNVVLWQRLA